MPQRPLPPIRMPSFHTVPVRARHDGWTPIRQAEFIGYLAETGCVRTAAAKVGMRRETAYRLRNRKGAESFNAAWDAALARGRGKGVAPINPGLRYDRKVTLSQLAWRIDSGLWRVRIRRGRYLGVSRKPDNSAVLALLSRTEGAFARWWQDSL